MFAMVTSRVISFLLFVVSLNGVQAQSSTPYTDAATGISFQRFTSSISSYSFSLALPEDSSSDFIGQISATTAGWAGVSLRTSMRNSLLVAAWSNGESIVSSLRTTAAYSSPGIYTGAAKIKPIEKGISVNSTGFKYTFLCENCIIDGMAFNASLDRGTLGWARSTDAVTTPSSPSSGLTFHNGGFGGFGVDLAGARSAEFASWAALAREGNTTIPSPPDTNNGTTPRPDNNTTVPISNSTYDYIVVGGGASGLVVSERLAETGKSVLVLERGGPSYYSSGGDLLVPWNETLTIYDIPGFFNALAGWPGNNAYCIDVPGRAGCILGGGTAVNGLQFVRPPSFDFDEKWPAGWKWSDVKAAAERVYERNPGTTSPSTDEKYYDNAVWDVASKFFASGGYKQVDTNEEPDEKYKVYSYPAINTQDGYRAGQVRTYLPLANRRSNFKLQLLTKVVRTVRTNTTITGVEVEDTAGRRSIININHGGKVILAAGAMSTPRILFNSGIGPVEQINIVKGGSTGVTLPPESAWIDSPVGLVRDHTYIQFTFNVTGGMKVLPPDFAINPSQEMVDLYAHGSGPLAQSFNRLMSYTTVTNDNGHKTLIQTHAYGSVNDTMVFLLAITHGSTSTGMLGITPEGNTEWADSPYLRSESDKEALTKAIDEILTISRLPNSTLTYNGPTDSTGASILEDALSLKNPNNMIVQGQHMTGTTIMGTDDGTQNGSSVVDTNCKVYGTDNVYVVDAGMHADLPTGNTMAIVMVAAEHAVQKIIALDDASNSTTPQRPVHRRRK